MATTVSTEPTRAAPVVLMVPDSRITMLNTAPSAAPEDRPRMSGLASGLRTMRWKIWPDTPKAKPTRMPVSTRGRRSVWTMNSLSVVPPMPVISLNTSPSGMGKSPTLTLHAMPTNTTPRTTRLTPTARIEVRKERPPRRTVSRPACRRTLERPRWRLRRRGAGRRRRGRGRWPTRQGGWRRSPAHSSAIRRRRTKAMKIGAPITAVTMPTSSSPGRTITRPITSAAVRKMAPTSME